jgi:hypothetical protein
MPRLKEVPVAASRPRGPVECHLRAAWRLSRALNYGRLGLEATAPPIHPRWSRYFIESAAWCVENEVPPDRLVRQVFDPVSAFRSGTPFPTMLKSRGVRDLASSPPNLAGFRRSIGAQAERLRLARLSWDESRDDLWEIRSRPAAFHPVLRYTVVRGRDDRLETSSRRHAAVALVVDRERIGSLFDLEYLRDIVADSDCLIGRFG